MAKVEVRNEKKYWVDADGDLVKMCNIGKEQKEDDRLVESVFKLVEKYQTAAEKTKNKILTKIGKTERRTFYSFDKSKKLEIVKKSRVEFDDRLEEALKFVVQYFETEGASENVILTIKKMFRRNRKGDANPNLLLKLKDLDFKHPFWQKAIKLVSDSQTIVPVKTYFQFSHRDETGAWIRNKLNFSAM